MAKSIKVENISKAYQLGSFGTGTISKDIERFLARVRGKEDPFLRIGEVNDRTTKSASNIVWSLKDIDFEIEQGDAVGIIGRNGAGKSTLLKILSRITSPTTGSIRLKGRVASLLEVGTGFHHELTGRENIFLNGAILGMRKRDIKRKFDEILDFSGVERYIDTPVKRYSSGMYVRLAFAVAAHLESEILIVDEVLAVGDAEFQNKCLGKIGDISQGEGRTVLFVSHNMGAVERLCSTTIYLNDGSIKLIGRTDNVINQYLQSDKFLNTHIDFDNKKLARTGNQKVVFKEAYLKNADSDINTRLFSIGDSIEICFMLKSNFLKEIDVKTSIELKSPDGIRIANMIDVDSNFQVNLQPQLATWYKVILRDIRLYPGIYLLSLYAGDMSSTEPYDYYEDCFSFEIKDGGNLTSRNLPKSCGLFFFTPSWSVFKP